MPYLRQLQSAINGFTDATGRALSWLLLAMMLLNCLVVILRYGFDQGSIFLQESVSYLHASVFMLGAAYALKHGAHVRVDIFYRRFSPRSKAWIDSLGTIIFLIPLCGYLLMSSWQFVLQSWQIREISPEPGGIPAVFLLKTLIPLMAANLSLQALAGLIGNLLTLTETAAETQIDG
jgi:TRAP-type mannitol/chloroaromatic compound transport system permease small subunit